MPWPKERGRLPGPLRGITSTELYSEVLLPLEEPPCCGRRVLLEPVAPVAAVLPLVLLFTSVRLRVETVPVVSGELERVVETFTSLDRRCSTDTPTLGEVSDGSSCGD
jgi:hypothetical protein